MTHAETPERPRGPREVVSGSLRRYAGKTFCRKSNWAIADITHEAVERFHTHRPHAVEFLRERVGYRGH